MYVQILQPGLKKEELKGSVYVSHNAIKDYSEGHPFPKSQFPSIPLKCVKAHFLALLPFRFLKFLKVPYSF